MTANTADKSSSIKKMYTQITNTWTYRHNVELINLVLPFQKDIDMRKCKLHRLLGRDGLIPALVTMWKPVLRSVHLAFPTIPHAYII